MARLIPIRDILYENVYLSELECKIIDHPTFQRLRRVHQNSTAYLTYPANHLTRFSHSIGVMHITSEMFCNGFNNADENVQDKFITETKKLLIDSYDFNQKSLEVDALYNNLFNISIKQYNIDYKINNSAINIICQAVRIASLIHDIGHFPFSHIFEYALVNRFTNTKEITDNIYNFYFTNDTTNLFLKNKNINVQVFIGKEYDIHELNGAKLLIDIFREHNIQDAVNQKILKIAIHIFLETREKGRLKDTNNNFLYSLHSIFSSSIDADRIDYTLRDPLSSGLKSGNFDYTSIYKNIKLIDFGSNIFEFAVQDNCISSIEQFFLQRCLLYEHVIYHHNVIRYNEVLKLIVLELFELLIDKNDNIIKTLFENYNLIRPNLNSINVNGLLFLTDNVNFDEFDDYRLLSLFKDAYNYTKTIDRYSKLNLLIDTFLNRKRNNLWSITKTYELSLDLYIDAHSEILNFSPADRSNLISYYETNIKTGDEGDNEKMTLNEEKFCKYITCEKFDPKNESLINFISSWDELLKNFQTYIYTTYSVVLLVNIKKSKVTDKDLNIYSRNKSENISYDTYSPLLANLKDFQANAVFYYFGAVFADIKNNENEKLRKNIKEEIKKYLQVLFVLAHAEKIKSTQ